LVVINRADFHINLESKKIHPAFDSTPSAHCVLLKMLLS